MLDTAKSLNRDETRNAQHPKLIAEQLLATSPGTGQTDPGRAFKL